MASDRFFDESTRLLTPHAFEFVLDAELKRAVRSQNFLTLVVVETKREWDGLTLTADEGLLGEVARILGHEVRDTDLFGAGEEGTLSLVLLDADYANSTKVIERLLQRIDNYEFPARLRISMGAACYPTHAVDAGSLKQKALTHPVVSWRSDTSPETRH